MIQRSQAGVALITVLLVLSLASVAAVSMTSRQQLDIRRTTNMLKIEEGYMALLAAEEFAKRLLAWDFREIPKLNSRVNTTTDGHGDLWNNPFLDTAKQTIGNFEVINFKFVDLQGRFNINSLVDAGHGPSAADHLAFRRLLTEKGLPIELADMAVDWVDGNTDRYLNGVEDTVYQNLSKPYLPPNRFAGSASELYRLMTVNLARAEDYDQSNQKRRDIIKKLLHDEEELALTALPTRTEINVNTAASPEVFMLLVPGLGENDAETLFNLTRNVGAGDEPPFQNNDDFWVDQAAVRALNIPTGERMPIAFSSEYFLFSAEASSGDLVVYCHTIFHRTRTPEAVTVVHRSFGKKGEI